MKSFIICLFATCITVASFAQKAKQNANTTLKPYLTYSCTMHPQYVSSVPAKCPICNKDMNLSKKEQMKMEDMKLYTCPMDSDSVLSTQPGKCPKCGMDLTEFKPADKSKKN